MAVIPSFTSRRRPESSEAMYDSDEPTASAPLPQAEQPAPKPKREVKIAGRMALSLLAAVILAPCVIFAGQFSGLLGRPAALPMSYSWAWLALAYLANFQACRCIGADTRSTPSKDESPAGREFDRRINRAISYFGGVAAFGLTLFMAMVCGLVAPQPLDSFAPLFLFLPMLAGLIVGDVYGFYTVKVAQVSVLI